MGTFSVNTQRRNVSGEKKQRKRRQVRSPELERSGLFAAGAEGVLMCN
jgi:hypothetical protein